MTTPQEMEADTVYEHFRGNNSTGKRCLWVRFTTKERKLMTTATKRFHLWAESQVPWVGAIQLRAVEVLEDTSRIILSFFVGETISDLEKVCFIFALIKFLIFSSFSTGLGSLTLVIWKKSLQSVIEKRVPAIHLKLQLNETLHKRHFSFPFYFFNLFKKFLKRTNYLFYRIYPIQVALSPLLPSPSPTSPTVPPIHCPERARHTILGMV